MTQEEMSAKSDPEPLSKAEIARRRELAALELLALLGEVAWHFGALPKGSDTSSQPRSAQVFGKPRPLVWVIQEVRRRSRSIHLLREKQAELNHSRYEKDLTSIGAEALTSLGLLAVDLATSEEVRRAHLKLNESLRAILEAGEPKMSFDDKALVDEYGNKVYKCRSCGSLCIQDFNEDMNMCDECVSSDNSAEVLEEMAVQAGLSPKEPV